jgi:hypothetical protein
MARMPSRAIGASAEMPMSWVTRTVAVWSGLQNRTRAEMALAELLDGERIPYEVEKVFLNGDRHIMVDFYLKSVMLAIEADGSRLHERSHKLLRPLHQSAACVVNRSDVMRRNRRSYLLQVLRTSSNVTPVNTYPSILIFVR